jgi:hypothetical protein
MEVELENACGSSWPFIEKKVQKKRKLPVSVQSAKFRAVFSKVTCTLSMRALKGEQNKWRKKSID